jgi:uncharacterized protein YbaP (TraB family)
MNVVPAELMTVPEHSAAFMRAVSGGRAFVREGFLFLSDRDWLVAIGYPLSRQTAAGEQTPPGGDFFRVLQSVLRESRAADCWLIAPSLPAALLPYRTESDFYYTLASDSPVPGHLRNPVKKANTFLRIEESRQFGADHRGLWAEFLRFKQIKPQARELFARIPFILNAPGCDIRLLDARGPDGSLLACLVMDYAPQDFCSYLIGARCGTNTVPHAGDALFARMLQRAGEEGKKYIHLGLGVNDGIRRFKIKWGGERALAYEEAFFPAEAAPGTENPASGKQDALRGLVFSSLLSPRETPGMILPGGRWPAEHRPYTMLWELRKNGKTSWIGGTAHTFCYSFAPAFRKLFAGVEVVIFEGPLGAADLAVFDRHGKTGDADTPRLLDLLTEEEIRRLERIVQGPQGKMAGLLNMAWPHPADVRGILASHRPWSAFFTLYNAFLERCGWNLSVDLEAWEIAHEMGRRVISLENVEEQIASLESVPLDRIIRFLKSPGDWPRRMRQSRAAYLAGDLKRMLDTGAEFPTRTGAVIGMRDQRFRERMRPWLEQGDVAVFVGTAHMLNLEHMLRDDGFEVVQSLPWRRKILSRLRGRR